jgi:hypothetical protein
MLQPIASSPSAPKIVVIETREGTTDPSAPPVAPRHSIRSVGPLASSLYPSRSIFPSVDAAANLPVRKRRALGVAFVAAAVVALGAGVAKVHQGPPLVATVVAGNAALRTTPTGATEFWASGSGPRFVLDPSLEEMDPNARAAIIDAFSTWDSASLGIPKATFTMTSTPGKAVQDGVNRIVYAPITVSGFEDALALTIGYADPTTGALGEADVIFNSNYKFHVFPESAASATCNGEYDVQNVATHETGHVYGLGEDMEDTTTTMYIHSAPCETHKRALSASDEKVMSGLYAQAATSTAAAQSSGCGGATVASRGPGSAGSAWAVGALGALLVLRRRRQSRSDG